ncbi:MULTISPECIES: D-tagatose-bisphosphate aldolase, class II, non-catalytic subunit [Vibrio]|uniref:D-tagatose-bisphosphate aldolase, class II, non-catalytic subunit n=1 Tax=Vibrio navarrensis TaxID=29495 RepID=A0AAJ4LWW7_9VIBR|nr:D-tagatose-bisphosphate aldolase, class II, non-catalytic subunit [Vibrio navarrensis]MBE3671183.1 D-tagatose-bisphosphate aldolase, class II, non-catalytic subunit [Vibrio navarrensis]MBE4594257.1 D-tagatose-bisphosphate aldolase, class II, non-catalytic subunit [Vibrio navarrensis]QPL56602.1 D-tagatose-bisphosphate aldolase, class II, non-catalytic subunit [Vibrio navarrensis]
MTTLLNIVKQHKAGNENGIYSVCSAHPLVLEAAILQAKKDKSPLLIEATSNQVDQFGGYTGMLPADFRDLVLNLAEAHGFNAENLILGGDHLGPNRWQDEPAAEAMAKAEVLIETYVAAGFTKIHLDCSMPCADDPVSLTDEIVAERAARLAKIAEDTAVKNFGTARAFTYVVGTEVPVPGGETEELHEVQPTSPEAARQTIKAHKDAFAAAGLDCWDRVVGLVVQPAVEFDHSSVIDYKPESAAELSKVVNEFENILFEAHSTDYQSPENYALLVRDHFAILKVGPQLTFAMREALYGLCAIEDEILPIEQRSNLRNVIESVMLAKPDNWAKYYHGNEAEQKFSRSYSLSDRIRYYWADETIQAAVDKLFANLKEGLPLALASQHLPEGYAALRSGEIENNPKAFVINKIQKTVLEIYARACKF